MPVLTLPKRPSVGAPRFARAAYSPSLVRMISSDARAKIDQAVKADPLVVFMKGTPDFPQCGFSRAVLQILQVQGVKPELVASYNCLEDQELRQAIKEYSDWPTIPQVYINGEFVGGCDILLNSTLSPALSITDRQCTRVASSRAFSRRQDCCWTPPPTAPSSLSRSVSLDLLAVGIGVRKIRIHPAWAIPCAHNS